MNERLKEFGWTIWVLILLIIVVFVLGIFGLGYKATIGKESVNIDRQIFKNSKSYVEGMGNDLAKYKYELQTEKDPVAKRAIVDLIINKYGDFDAEKLDNPDLKNFLLDAKNGRYNE